MPGMWPFAVRCAFAAVLVGPPAGAHQDDQSPFAIDVRAGMGLVAGTYKYERESQPSDGSRPELLRFRAGLSGRAGQLSVTPAYALSPATRLGVTLHAGLFPSLAQAGRIGESHVNSALLVGVGATGLFRPRTNGFEAKLTFGAEHAGFSTDTSDIGSKYNVFENEPALGPFGALHFGYVSDSGFGVSTGGSYSYLVGERSVFTPLTFTILGTWSSW